MLWSLVITAIILLIGSRLSPGQLLIAYLFWLTVILIFLVGMWKVGAIQVFSSLMWDFMISVLKLPVLFIKMVFN